MLTLPEKLKIISAWFVETHPKLQIKTTLTDYERTPAACIIHSGIRYGLRLRRNFAIKTAQQKINNFIKKI